MTTPDTLKPEGNNCQKNGHIFGSQNKCVFCDHEVTLEGAIEYAKEWASSAAGNYESVLVLRKLIEAATSAINLQERVKALKGAVDDAAASLEQIRFEAGTDAQIRPPAHVLETILNHIHDWANEALANLAAVRK